MPRAGESPNTFPAENIFADSISIHQAIAKHHFPFRHLFHRYRKPAVMYIRSGYDRREGKPRIGNIKM